MTSSLALLYFATPPIVMSAALFRNVKVTSGIPLAGAVLGDKLKLINKVPHCLHESVYREVRIPVSYLEDRRGSKIAEELKMAEEPNVNT